MFVVLCLRNNNEFKIKRRYVAERTCQKCNALRTFHNLFLIRVTAIKPMEALEDADTQKEDALFKSVSAYKTNV